MKATSNDPKAKPNRYLGIISSMIYFSILIIALMAPAQTYASSDHFKMLQDKSAFIQNYANRKLQMVNRWRQSSHTLSIYAPTNPFCITDFWWTIDSNKTEYIKNKIKREVKRALKYYPKMTIDECSKVSPIVEVGIVKSHWRNKTMYFVERSVIATKNNSTGEVNIRPAFVASNFSVTSDPTKVTILDENLKKVCELKNVTKSIKSRTAHCFGRGKANVVASWEHNPSNGKHRQITIFLKGQTLFVAQELTPQQFKNRFPEIYGN